MEDYEASVMRAHFENLVHSEAQARGMSISVPQHQQMQAQYGNNPEQSKFIDLYHQQSLRNAMTSMGLSQIPDHQQQLEKITANAGQISPIHAQQPQSNQSLPNVNNIHAQHQQLQQIQQPIHHTPVASAHAVAAAYTDVSTPTPKHPSEHIISPASSNHHPQQKGHTPTHSNQFVHPSPVPSIPSMPRHSISHQSPPLQVQQVQHVQQQMVSQSMPMPQPTPPVTAVSAPQPQLEQTNSIHPAVQQLYEQQQTLLEKLQLLEQDDPDPQSAKLWSIMQRIFTEENAQQRQQNIADLTSTLEKKHAEVTNLNDNGDNNLSISDQRLLRSIHEMSKETKNELKEMRQQLDEERKINNELRSKVRKKNRQLKVLSQEAKDNDNDDDSDTNTSNNYNYTIPPMAYDPNNFGNMHQPYGHGNHRKGVRGVRQQLINDISIEDSEYSLTNDETKPSTFQNWCVNMGFGGKKTKCSWF